MDHPYPPHRPVSAAEAMAADREASEVHGIPPLVMMEHAGMGLARIVASYPASNKGVTVLCGPGNNGGDGYACARFLAGWGVPVKVVRCSPSPPASEAARLEHRLAVAAVGEVVAAAPGDLSRLEDALAGAGVAVDALFGVGLSRPLSPPYPDWIAAVNAARAVRVAADVPSGIDADTGAPMPVAVKADVTAAMAFAKRGCSTAEGARWSGRVVEVDVGLPAAVHRRYLARA